MTRLIKRTRDLARSGLSELELLQTRISSIVRSADISIFHDFAPPPGGGGHQFLRALRREIESREIKVENNQISHTTRACLMNSFNFNSNRLKRLRRKDVLYVHRVDGPIDVYRGREDGIDLSILRVNQELAQKTIFQSHYSLDKHSELGLNFREPVVILNAADPSIFHSRDRQAFGRDRKIRLLASSWLDNIHKGAPVYQWLDEHLNWERYEFTFVGRSVLRFQNVCQIAPVDSRRMAELYRENDIYLTASKNDPCSNSLIEALTCGLPALYLKSGGHPEIVGDAGFGFESAEEIPALLDRLVAEYEIRQDRIATPSIKDVTSAYLSVMELL